MDHEGVLVVGARRLCLGLGIVLLASSAAHGQQVDLVSRAAMPADSVGRSSLAPGYFWSASDDGRYSLFLSSAPNVVPGQVDINAGNDAFVYDRVSGTTTLVSHGPDSAVITGLYPVKDAVMSADGAYVAFVGSDGVSLFERATGLLRSVPGADYNSIALQLSADGRFVACVKPNYFQARYVVTLSKQVKVAKYLHHHYARVTFDTRGKIIKASASR